MFKFTILYLTERVQRHTTVQQELSSFLNDLCFTKGHSHCQAAL